MENYRFETKVIHAGQKPDNASKALATPIYQTSTFCFDTVEEAGDVNFGRQPGYMYSRASNPTVDAIQEKLCVLEGGEAAVFTSSGMGAVGSLMVGMLENGDHLISGDTVYGGTDYVLRTNLPRMGVEVTMVDTQDLEKIKAAIKPNTKMIYIESPTNPTLKLTDIAAVSRLAKEHNIKVAEIGRASCREPPIQYPLALGADLVVHSVTKYINGHGDVIAGAVIGSAEDIKKIKAHGVTKLCGSTPSPFNAYLTLRGAKTMPLRVGKHCENAMALAEFLEKRDEVALVNYPGLKSHPQHELAKVQMNGMYSGIISFELKGGINGLSAFDAGKKLLNNLKLMSIAVSLGDPDTLIEHPASMTHDNVPAEERAKVGITDGLIRISVGLEHIDDLKEDLEQAFETLKNKN